MFLTLTNGLIILLGLVLAWCILFSIFNEKSARRLGIKLGILVLFLSPFIARLSYDFYAIASRQLFLMGANGEIQLAYSPLKVPKNQSNHYCDRFTDSKGNSLNRSTVRDKHLFCGIFWNMGEYDVVFLPYKLLGDNKAIYWASPELKIIGPIPPELLLIKNKAKSTHPISSEKPNRIYVEAGKTAHIIVTKPFKLPSDKGHKEKTISSGTVLSGVSLKSFDVSEKLSQGHFKLFIENTSCIASSDTHIKPDYDTATAIANIISLNCSKNEEHVLPIEAIATVSGRVLYPKE
ncbi:TPA: hypothetical protein ACM2VO_002426 [Legionella pneumophila]